MRLLYWSDARAYSIGADEPDYVIPAQTLLRDGQYVDTFVSHNRTWTRVPLTAIFFAGSFLFVHDEGAQGAMGDDAALMQPRYDALNLAQIVVSLGTVALLMLLAARIFPQRGRRAALIAGVIAALYPPLASSPAQRALSEPLSIGLIFLSIYALSFWQPGSSLKKQLAIGALAGALLGITALSRAVGLAFLPFVWLWLLVVTWAATKDKERRTKDEDIEQLSATKQSTQYAIRNTSYVSRFTLHVSRLRRPLASALAASVACLLVIAPWTYYNYRQYGGFLLLETANTTAYWNYHNFRGEDITARMAALPDPADRLSLIMREGTANILEYPDKAVGSTLFAFRYFWHLESNSAVLLNPWDMTQREPDVPDLLHSDAAFVLLGLAGMCGLVGVGLRRPVGLAGRTLLLSNLWLLCMVLLGMVVPYDGRYRLPAAPSLILLAAGLIALADWRTVFSPRRAWALLRRRPLVVAVSTLLCVWVLVGAYTPNIPPLLRSLYQAWRGDVAASLGDVPSSFGRYKLAQEAFPSFFWPYRHEAERAQQIGRGDEARALYNTSLGFNSDDAYGLLGFADLMAKHPEWEPTPTESGRLKRDESDWLGNPWNSFQPSATESVDVGTGRDSGYIRGFHLPDRPSPDLDYRWSKGRATIRIPLPPDQYGAITLRMSAPAVGPSEPMPVSVSVDGGAPTQLQVSTGWADYRLPLTEEKGRGGRTLYLDITSPVRNPAQLAQGSRDERNLGVGLDRVTVNK